MEGYYFIKLNKHFESSYSIRINFNIKLVIILITRLFIIVKLKYFMKYLLN